MGGKKKVATYAPEAIKHLGEYLQKIRNSEPGRFKEVRVNNQGLEKAIKQLPREHRERIEKFWGLTGGLNHSKKAGHCQVKDVAFMQMCKDALTSLAHLSKLEIAKLYDENFDSLISFVNSKLNKKGIKNSDDLENVKYLMAFLVIFENGPKMSFEQDPMIVETKVDSLDYLDEYEALNEMCMAIAKFPDNSINLALVKSMFEMMDLKDCMAIYKNFGIPISRNVSLEGVEEFRDPYQRKAFLEEVDSLKNFGQIRAFKEKIFRYGAWNVTCNIVLGYTIDLEPFWKAIGSIRKDWRKVEQIKTAQKVLNTSKGIRNLDVYSMGELEFTDPYEIMTLYLERDLIASE